jgi:PKD repeat protein
VRRLLAIPLSVALLAATAGAASAADFTISPATANPGQEITVTPVLTALEVATISAVGFQFDDEIPTMDNTAPFEAVTHTYTTDGTKTVTMRIDYLIGGDAFIPHTIRINAAPTASFTYTPTVPNVGQSVVFNAGASADDAALENSGFEWDFNGNGTYEAVGQSISHSFGSPGDKTVRLRVTDSGNRQATYSRVVHVNRPPTADFFFTPRAPKVGDRIAFTSVSEDPDNPIAVQAWDLDGDGQYDDARGDTASRTFTTPGAHTVRLRVTDSRGRAASVARNVTVAASPPATPPERIRPWPKIRIVGFARFRTRIDLLTVRTLAGALVKARCSGRDCPKRKATSTRSNGRLVRVRWLERRLRAGTRIFIAVTMPSSIGRYETILLRKNKRPQRRTLCIWPGEAKPRKCS